MLTTKSRSLFYYKSTTGLKLMPHMSRLRACGPVIPGILSLWPELVRPWYAAGRHGTRSVMVMNTISLLLLGRHALTSLEGGGPCSLGTFDYGVVGHLAFRLT